MLLLHALDPTSALADLLFSDKTDVLSKLLLEADLFHSQLTTYVNVTILSKVFFLFCSLLCSSSFHLLFLVDSSRTSRINIQHFDNLFHVLLWLLLFSVFGFFFYAFPPISEAK